MVSSLGILACLIQARSYGHAVLLHGAKHFPVTHHDNDIGDHEGTIKPSVEQVNSSWTHHPPPAQQVAWAEEEVIQRQKIGEPVDYQHYYPNGGNEKQCPFLCEDLVEQVSFLDTEISIESRQSHEVDGYLGKNRHCKSVESTNPITESSSTVNDGLNCQRHNSRGG